MKIIRFLDREGKLGNRMDKIDFQAETLRWVMIMQNTANEMKKKFISFYHIKLLFVIQYVTHKCAVFDAANSITNSQIEYCKHAELNSQESLFIKSISQIMAALHSFFFVKYTKYTCTIWKASLLHASTSVDQSFTSAHKSQTQFLLPMKSWRDHSLDKCNLHTWEPNYLIPFLFSGPNFRHSSVYGTEIMVPRIIQSITENPAKWTNTETASLFA